MIKDKNGKNIERGKWYQVFDDTTDLYEFRRFIFPIAKHGDNIVLLEFWRNSNHPNLKLSFNVLSNAFFADHSSMLASKTEWADRVREAFNKHAHSFIIGLFEDRYIKRRLRKLRS